ncbi:MAG: hypothetical protein PHN88_12045 [Ignavibacteria bacterium]|nr:hypothetical protein [Ignavibacteria bacterium]
MAFIEKIYDLCVKMLQSIAEITGTSYKFVNVMIFCVIGPIVFFILLFRIHGLKKEHLKYKGLYERFVSRDINNKE